MKVNEVTNLLSHYRHDWMNQLQILHGYASMGKMEKVQEKLQGIIQDSQEESKLMKLQSPHFALWVIRFNTQYDQFRLTYSIQSQHNLEQHDQALMQNSQNVMNIFEEFINSLKLYMVTLVVSGQDKPEVTLSVDGELDKHKDLLGRLEGQSYLKDVQAVESENGHTYTMKLLLNER